MHPSKKALAREREKLRVMISKKCCFQPLPELLGELNRHLKGWSSYFRAGYNRAFRQINAQVAKCLARHLRRRSQPRMATEKRHLGLCSPATALTHLPVNASRKNVLRKPDAGIRMSGLRRGSARSLASAFHSVRPSLLQDSVQKPRKNYLSYIQMTA